MHVKCENLKTQNQAASVQTADCALLSGETDKLKQTLKAWLGAFQQKLLKFNNSKLNSKPCKELSQMHLNSSHQHTRETNAMNSKSAKHKTKKTKQSAKIGGRGGGQKPHGQA